MSFRIHPHLAERHTPPDVNDNAGCSEAPQSSRGSALDLFEAKGPSWTHVSPIIDIEMSVDCKPVLCRPAQSSRDAPPVLELFLFATMGVQHALPAMVDGECDRTARERCARPFNCCTKGNIGRQLVGEHHCSIGAFPQADDNSRLDECDLRT